MINQVALQMLSHDCRCFLALHHYDINIKNFSRLLLVNFSSNEMTSSNMEREQTRIMSLGDIYNMQRPLAIKGTSW